MTARYATRNVLLAYLRTGGVPRTGASIVKYMAKRYGTSPAATRTQLCRMVKAGLITRIGRHWYAAGVS